MTPLHDVGCWTYQSGTGKVHWLQTYSGCGELSFAQCPHSNVAGLLLPSLKFQNSAEITCQHCNPWCRETRKKLRLKGLWVDSVRRLVEPNFAEWSKHHGPRLIALKVWAQLRACLTDLWLAAADLHHPPSDDLLAVDTSLQVDLPDPELLNPLYDLYIEHCVSEYRMRIFDVLIGKQPLNALAQWLWRSGHGAGYARYNIRLRPEPKPNLEDRDGDGNPIPELTITRRTR